jgi:O-antigen/teichoic acid export membrane protein
VRSIRMLRNVVSNYLRFVINGLLGFVLTPLMVRMMGDGDYGLWVAVFSLTGYFGLFDQAIRPSLVRYVARDHALGDTNGLSRTLSSAFALYTGVGVIVLAATVIVAAQFTRWFQVDPTQAGHADQLVLLAGATIALGFPFGVFGAALSGLQRYDLANGIGVAVSVARAFAFVWVLHAGGGIVGLAWVSLVMSLVGHVWSAVVAWRLMPGLRVGPSWVDRPHLKLIGAYSGVAFFGAIAQTLQFQTDALVITAFLGAASVTPFALAAGLVENVRTLVYAATWVLSPSASEFEALGEERRVQEMMIGGAKFAVLMSWPVLFGLLIFGGNFLETWVGPSYRRAAPLLTILAVPTFLSLPQSATSAILFGISRHKGVVVLAITSALLNLGLSIWWVRPYGLAGVAMGTAVPLASIYGVATILYGCRATGLPLGRYLWEGMGRPGLCSLAFAVPALAAQALWRPVGWWPLAAATAVPWLVFAACAWRFGLTDVERRRVGRAVPGLWRRKAAAAGAGR